MNITVAETKEFHHKIKRLMDDIEINEFINYISCKPKSGILIQGAGGIRKIRWQRSGMGKRGGVRIIYYYHSNDMPLYLLTVFSKSEKDNLSKSERNELAKLVDILIEHWFGG